MSTSEVALDTSSLTGTGEETIYNQTAAGGLAVLFGLSDMGASDVLVIRHYVTIETTTELLAVKTIAFGVTEDDSWDGTFGDTSSGYQTWVFGFGSEGGSISIEATSGTFDVTYSVLNVGGPEG